jgi:hypothetical protein
MALALAAAPASAAVLVQFADAGSPTASDNVFEDFSSYGAIPAGTGADQGGGFWVYSPPSASGEAAVPAFGSTGNYGAIKGPAGSKSFNLNSNSFGFTLGSLDAYNTLELTIDGVLNPVVLSGGQIINGLSFTPGDQFASNANGFVRIFSTAGKITSATFKSTQNSFEFDNLAAGVPEPSTWAMMILGIGFAGAAMRRRQTVAVKYA